MGVPSDLLQDINFVPRNLTGYSINLNSMYLSWDAPLSGVFAGYGVYRAFDNTEVLTPIAFVTGLNYTDTSVESERKYYYRVTSVDSGVQVLYDTNFIPQNVYTVTDNSAQQITLNWQAPINIVSGYRIYRSSQFDAQFLPIGDTTDLTYIDSGLDLGIACYYRVASVF